MKCFCPSGTGMVILLSPLVDVQLLQTDSSALADRIAMQFDIIGHHLTVSPLPKFSLSLPFYTMTVMVIQQMDIKIDSTH